jgi:formamidase
MSGLGGLNKSPNGVVVGLVQLQLPVVETPAQVASQTQRIVDMVGKARRGYPGMDLVVFPEYSLHGRAPHLGLLLDHGEEPAWQSVQHRPDL